MDVWDDTYRQDRLSYKIMWPAIILTYGQLCSHVSATALLFRKNINRSTVEIYLQYILVTASILTHGSVQQCVYRYISIYYNIISIK